jgi:MoaA/NifB/PqqE/SkfB family radical SAM enzyme
MVVVRKCNLACGYCNEFDDSSPPVDTSVLKARIDKIDELGAFSLELTGGEPLLHPDLPDLIAHAKTKRFRKVMLISNAFLMDERKIEALNKAGLDDLQVSVDGVKPNDVTIKVLKSVRPKLELLSRLARFRVTLSGVIGSAAPEEALEVVLFAKEKGFRPRVLLIHGADGQLRLSAEEMELYKRIQREIGERFSEAHDYRAKLMEGKAAPFKCRAGSRYLYVDEFGTVRWCSQTFQDFGIPLEKYSNADLRRQFSTHKPCTEQCTLGCARTTSAYDEWRGQELDPDPAYANAEPLFRISPHPSRRSGDRERDGSGPAPVREIPVDLERSLGRFGP